MTTTTDAPPATTDDALPDVAPPPPPADSPTGTMPKTPIPDETPPPAPRQFRSRRPSKKAQPIPFTITLETTEDVLDDDNLPTGETRDTEVVEHFNAVPMVTGEVLLDVAAAMTQDGSWQAIAIKRLFDAAIPADEKPRWRATLGHKDGPDLSTLGEIADWLCGEYGERPTDPAA